LIYSPGFKTKSEKQNNKSHVEQEKKKRTKSLFLCGVNFLKISTNVKKTWMDALSFVLTMMEVLPAHATAVTG